MYRTIYERNTGKIIICRRMSDQLLAERLANYPNQASLDVYTEDVRIKKVDLDTLTVVDNIQTETSEQIIQWMKDRRKLLLISNDWTQGADSPLSDSKKAEWATYRQALRDLPASYPNPTSKADIIWPTKPE